LRWSILAGNVNEKVKVIGAKAPKGRMGAPEEITSSVDFWPTMIPVLFFDRSFSLNGGMISQPRNRSNLMAEVEENSERYICLKILKRIFY
jgi:hypothetical protein